MLDDALLLTRIDVNREQFASAPVSLDAALIRALESTAKFADSRPVKLAMPPANLCLVVGDEELLARAFHALLDIAIKFSKERKTVRMAYEMIADSPAVIIDSHGRTISITALPRFFEIFSMEETVTPGGDLGLSPPMACRILSLFGSTVSVPNLDSFGIQLTVSLRETVLSSARL